MHVDWRVRLKLRVTLRNAGAMAALVVTMLFQDGGVIHAQAPTDAELRRLGEAYAQAWGKGDARALAGLHTTEAILIAADGKVSVGRAAIEQAMKEALTGPYRGTKLGMTPGQTSRAGQDVYVAEGTYLVTGGMPPAGYPTRGRYLNTLVRMNGRWFIASHADVAAQRPPK
jgi:uncharacterized protein (TIGR02246 family)